MPKIKLKPNIQGIEIGVGNLIDFKISAGETVEVAEEILSELLSHGHLEQVEDEKRKAPEKEPREDGHAGQ